MKALGYVIVRSKSNYNNDVGGVQVNYGVEDVKYINREVTVEAAPPDTILSKGDRLLIHHNILRHKNNTVGLEIKSDYHIEGDLYFVPPTEVFMINKGGGWKALSPFIFVEPTIENKGIVRYPNPTLPIEEGKEVIFKDDSDYKFEVEGKELYRMKNSDIVSVL